MDNIKCVRDLAEILRERVGEEFLDRAGMVDAEDD